MTWRYAGWLINGSTGAVYRYCAQRWAGGDQRTGTWQVKYARRVRRNYHVRIGEVILGFGVVVSLIA